MEEEDPWNGGWAKDGAAEEPTRVAGASAAGREGPSPLTACTTTCFITNHKDHKQVPAQ